MTVNPDPNSAVVSDVAALITDLLTVAGVLGVAVPAFIQQPMIILQIAGAVVAIGSVVVSHFQLKSVKVNLQAATAAARKG